jgi:DNA-binding IclR family transcriptional regulator
VSRSWLRSRERFATGASLTLDPAGKVSVSLAADTRSELPVLTDALDAIEALAEKSDRPVVVILDEIQQIVIERSAAEKQLRATIQAHRHVSYVFAGSAVRLLSAPTSRI